MKVDKAPMGRTLRKRKGKVAKHLKKAANEKEMKKRLKRNYKRPRGADWNATSINKTIPTSINTRLYQTSCKRASTDITYYPSIDTGVDRVREGDYSIGSCADDHYYENYAEETVVHERGVDEPPECFTYEEFLNYQKRSDTNSLFAQVCGRDTRFYRPLNRAKRPSIDINTPSSIDIRPKPPSTVREKAKLNNNYLTPDEFGIFRDPDGYAREMDGHALQIDVDNPTSIDRRPKFGKRAYDRDGTKRFHWEEKDEYGVYRDNYGHARDVDGHIICVSKDDIRSLLERASMEDQSYLCLPEHARSFTQTKLVPEIYTKDEINEMFYGVYGAQEKNEGDFQMKLDGVYYTLNDSSWLTTCMEEIKQDIARIQTQRAAEATAPSSIDRKLSTSIGEDLTHSNPMKSQSDSYTRAEIDQLVEEIYITLESAEDKLDRRCDDIYFPVDLTMSSFTSQMEAIHREIVEIQGYIASRPEASTSIDRRNNISTDSRGWIRHTHKESIPT
ncbi:hypothetical protein DY000_02047968 [Brassica cretica]|uniref:OCRE domain-containing protein n=1 Tax=Brassica cretica TaxID=69181 RepID=A0ABQ7F2B4_BRACR|nr:hypothetical protein DY000_02047968 [Brassica cretica]